MILMITGRPVKDIDFAELKELMRFYPSLEETAGWFDVSPDTVARSVKNESGLTFREFRERYMATTKIAIKRAAIERALEGNDKMLIHCLRTLTDMDDRERGQDLSLVDNKSLLNEAKTILLNLE